MSVNYIYYCNTYFLRQQYCSLLYKYVYLAWAETWNFAWDFSVYFFIHLFFVFVCAEFESVGQLSIFVFFSVFTVTISILLNMLTIISRICSD